ncbi:hypothetical protein [Halobacillus mangrovi]|uniref:hypothetical protein n=1 Tax=Halobacillus mangrovi TaxID=402384 RepID=UPI003D99E4C9
MRDLSYVIIDDTYELVISSDNAANIGEKEKDQIQAPYSLVAESLFRVAFMENRSIGAHPIAVVLYNFTDESVWREFTQTIKKKMNAMGFEVPITGSTESNFPLPHSAFGLSIIGKVEKRNKIDCQTPANARFAVIGEPLVGEEVIRHRERMAPLALFEELVKNKDIYEVLPVGSKGIEKEVKALLQANDFSEDVQVKCSLDLYKSGGPATCFVITYNPGEEVNIRALAGDVFHHLTIAKY